MPAVALSRVGESGPGGEDLCAGTWQRLEALLGPLTARADLPAGLPDRDRGLRVHRRRERPVHRGQAVDQAGQPGSPGPPARSVGPSHRSVPGAG